MENCSNAYHCAMTEQGGKCCDGLAKHNCGAGGYLFGAAVIVGLIVIIVMQAKTLKAVKKMGSKKK